MYQLRKDCIPLLGGDSYWRNVATSHINDMVWGGGLLLPILFTTCHHDGQRGEGKGGDCTLTSTFQISCPWICKKFCAIFLRHKVDRRVGQGRQHMHTAQFNKYEWGGPRALCVYDYFKGIVARNYNFIPGYRVSKKGFTCLKQD